jgi:hypothetical protein
LDIQNIRRSRRRDDKEAEPREGGREQQEANQSHFPNKREAQEGNIIQLPFEHGREGGVWIDLREDEAKRVTRLPWNYCNQDMVNEVSGSKPIRTSKE